MDVGSTLGTIEGITKLLIIQIKVTFFFCPYENFVTNAITPIVQFLFSITHCDKVEQLN